MNLRDYDLIIVNSSGGKDSQTTLDVIVNMSRTQESQVPIHVVHADLGKAEWDGTSELAETQTKHYDLPFHITRRRRADGQVESLLDYVRRRGRWPDSKNRYCTSDFKRDTCAVVIRRIANELTLDRPVRVLNCFGFRAEESPARAKRQVLAVNRRLSCSKRVVEDYLPIHDWTEKQVWENIRRSGVPYHRAYDLGMPRLSCSFCIFAPRAALMIAGKARPEMLAEYVAVEAEIGHDFQHRKPIRDIQAALARGEEPGVIDGNWNM